MKISSFITEPQLAHLHATHEISELTHADQSTKLWTRHFGPTTLESACMHGMVMRGGEILARPMRSFFPIETEGFPETRIKNLKKVGYTVTSYLDGYGATLYKSTTNLPMLAGHDWFHQQPLMWGIMHYRHRHRTAEWPEGYSPNFVIVHPNHPRKLRYREEQIYLVSLVNVEDGTELPWQNVKDWAAHNDFPLVPEVKGSLYDFPNLPLADRGVVVRWDVPGEAPLRVAILSEAFDKTRQTVEKLTPADICDLLENDDAKALEQLKSSEVPAGFRGWVQTWENRLLQTYRNLEDRCCEIFQELDGDLEFPLAEDEKPEVMKKYEELCGTDRWTLPIIRKLIDDEDYPPLLWQLVRSSTRGEGRWQG